MKRITRLIIYEGPDEWVDGTIARSFPEGINILGTDRKIAIVKVEGDEKEHLGHFRQAQFVDIDSEGK